MNVGDEPMKIQVGDVFKMADGTGIRILKYEGPEGKFLAQVRSYSTGEWTEYQFTGDARKLPAFLSEQNAVREQ